jgi:hypothetical protein
MYFVASHRNRRATKVKSSCHQSNGPRRSHIRRAWLGLVILSGLLRSAQLAGAQACASLAGTYSGTETFRQTL